MIYRLILLFALSVVACQAQNIRFTETGLSSTIALAQEAGKYIFVDTYASYCKPCKKMELEFRDRAVADYFNANFINVRVDMESKFAEDFKNAYGIVFLPTLLFLDSNGNQRISVDRVVPAEELLSMGKFIIGKSMPPQQVVTATPAHHKKIEKQPEQAPDDTTTDDISLEPGEGKILYVMGQDGGDLPPEILKEEAYFRMELMDGSHTAAATKYLDTQTDWSTETNIRFIHDFIQDARSKEFDYLIANREKFDQILGTSTINNTINILVNKELERAFPRPDEDRIKELKSYL